MKISIKYRNINVRMTNPGSTRGNVSSKIYTQEELSKCLYQILDQRTPNGTYTFYLYNLYIEGSDILKYLPNYIIQNNFNEVIQLFIDVKEQNRICANNVNNIILDVKFNDSTDRSSTKLVGKLIQVYNTSKSIKISLDTGIALSEIQESLADKDLSVCYKNDQIILNGKKEMQPNTILLLKSKDVNSSSEALQLTKEELEIIKDIMVEDWLMEDVVDDTCLISNWYNDHNCVTM